jgi:recombination protein RecT
MAVDIITRTRDVVASVENPAFVSEIEALLPDTLPVRRFVQVAKTAIRTNPDLVGADENSLFASIVRCAQDGLIPDGHEAALVPYKGKVSYLPMVAGLRKVAAEYGWTITAAVVFDNDDFDYSEEPPTLTHKPARPGTDRGERIAAYAVARHADGRRIQRVMDADAIAKVRAKAQTQSVWNEWTDAMWMKSPTKAVVKVLPFAESDRVRRLLADDFIEEGSTAAETLYGPVANVPAVEPPAADVREAGQQAEAARDAAASAPGTDDGIVDGEFEPIEDDEAPAVAAEELAAAGTIKVTSGAWKDRTLDEIAEAGDEGATWLLVQLKKATPGSAKWAPLATVIRARLPETWQAYETWKAAQS